MTKFKDVAHFYLGCKGILTKKKTYGSPKRSEERLDASLLNSLELLPATYSFKPLLRQLSSMTEDEKLELWDSFGIDGLKTFDIESKEGEYMGTIPMQWNSYRLLLSKSFDLFGLIPSGEAIEQVK